MKILGTFFKLLLLAGVLFVTSIFGGMFLIILGIPVVFAMSMFS